MNPTTEGEDLVRLRRQGSDQAIQLALEGKWEEAATLNRSILAIHPSDVDAWNRLGKSLLELGRYRDANDAYGKALQLDPVNSISKRNLERLSALKEVDEEPRRVEATSKVAQDIFIEEVGKSGVTLLQGAAPETLARLTAGDEVFLKSGEELIQVENLAGEVLGSIEPKLALRLLRMIEGGNRYAAAVKSVNENEAQLIIKEIFRDPSQTRLSFPAVGGEGVRPYIKESLLRYSGDEDDDDVEEIEEPDDWGEAEPETAAEPTITFSSYQNVIERDVDVDEEEEQ